jgi:hypothetical protein
MSMYKRYGWVEREVMDYFGDQITVMELDTTKHFGFGSTGVGHC